MAYNQALNQFDYKPNRATVDLSKLIDDVQRREIDLAQSDARTLAADQEYGYKESVHPAMKTQEENRANHGGLVNKGLEAGLPVLQVEGKKAGIESGILDEMFQPRAPNLPPYIANQSGPVAQPEPAYDQNLPPQSANRFEGNTLAELRQKKANAGPASDFMGRLIDPMIKARSDAEEVGPALQEITAVAEMRGGTREEARKKGAALSAVLSKYPAIASDPRIKEAISTAMPRNPDLVFSPSSGANADRMKTQQVIGLENQLRDEYDKAATESQTIARAGQDIAAALKTNNSLSIGTAISKFSKIKDPTTGVLGGEADVTEKAAMGDAWNRIQGMAQKTLEGGATPETIRSFEDATRDLMRVQKAILVRVQAKAKNRFQTYATRFPDLGLSIDAVMGSDDDRARDLSAFDAFPDSSGAKKIASKAEFDALPSGTEYIGPSGKKARKP